MLSILSDIFDDFDRLCDEHAVDKIKTIGDAYIVCAGALDNDAEQHRTVSEARRYFAAAAQRVVRMGLAMQEVVKKKAEKEGIDIAVRIGVHTGNVTGGIIGTVRFHFDMWGNGVNGSVKMEETGIKFRVHISDTTHELVHTKFTLEPPRETPEEIREDTGIKLSYIVEKEKPGGHGEKAASRLGATLSSVGGSRGDLTIELVDASSGRSGGRASRERRSSRGLWSRVRNLPVDGLVSRALRRRSHLSRSGGSAHDPHGSGSHRDPASDRASHQSSCADRAAGGGRDARISMDDSNFFVRNSNERTTGGGAPAMSKRNSMFAATGGPRISSAAGGGTPRGAPHVPKLGAKSRESRRPGAAIDEEASAGPFDSMASTPESSGVMAGGMMAAAPAPGANTPRNKRASSSGGGMSATQQALNTAGEALRRSCVAGMPSAPNLEAGTSFLGGSGVLPPVGLGGEPIPTPRIAGAEQAEEQRRHDEERREESISAMDVRLLMPEEVHEALMRSARILACLTFVWAFYDALTWYNHPLIVEYDMTMLLGRFMIIRLGGVLPVAAGTWALLKFKHVSSASLPAANVVLVAFTNVLVVAAIVLQPDNNRQNSLCLSLFMTYFGYTTLALPLSYLVPIQVLTAGLIPMLVEHFSTMINTELRTPPTSFAAATGGGGPAIVATDFASGVDLPWPPASPPPISPPPLFGYDSVWEDDHTVTWPTVTIFIMVANVFGILHNRKLRSNLHNHAMLLRRHAANMDLISSEVIQCQELLANIFPPQVLAQLQNTIPGMDRASPGQSIAERFEDCTFLFAKIVGLKQITEDEERDPHDVVAALQNIFDRYDALTETFKVQKVRKTVNEYYMVAAGLPDRTLIDGRKDRALAIAALSFSMVHVMDIVNTELSEMGFPHLQCQIGIHSGAAIAGVIGHKRFQYDLCGDAVNTAARMCAYSAPGCINCSEVAHDLLKGEYETIDRGARQVKGKGSMRLYYLVGRTNPTLREQMRLALAAPAVDRESALALPPPPDSLEPSLAGEKTILPPAPPLAVEPQSSMDVNRVRTSGLDLKSPDWNAKASAGGARNSSVNEGAPAPAEERRSGAGTDSPTVEISSLTDAEASETESPPLPPGRGASAGEAGLEASMGPTLAELGAIAIDVDDLGQPSPPPADATPPEGEEPRRRRVSIRESGVAATVGEAAPRASAAFASGSERGDRCSVSAPLPHLQESSGAFARVETSARARGSSAWGRDSSVALGGSFMGRPASQSMSPQVSYGSSGGSAGMSSRLSELIDRGDATQRALASRSRGISCSQAAALQRMCRMPISNAAMEGAIEAAALGGLMEASSSAGRSNPSLPRPAQQGAELTRAKSMGRRGPPGAEQQGGFSRFLSFNARKPPPAGAAGVDLGAGYQSAIHAGRGTTSPPRAGSPRPAPAAGLPPRPAEGPSTSPVGGRKKWTVSNVLGGFRSGTSAATFARSASMAHMTADEEREAALREKSHKYGAGGGRFGGQI